MRFAAAAVVLTTLPSLVIAQRSSLSVAEIPEIAGSAYTFAYPLVLMEFTRQGVPTNVFRHIPEFPSASFRMTVRLNDDTLYFIAWLDVSKPLKAALAPVLHGALGERWLTRYGQPAESLAVPRLAS